MKITTKVLDKIIERNDFTDRNQDVIIGYCLECFHCKKENKENLNYFLAKSSIGGSRCNEIVCYCEKHSLFSFYNQIWTEDRYLLHKLSEKDVFYIRLVCSK